jgi:MFS family permease
MSEAATAGRAVRLRTIYASHAVSHGLVLVLPAVLVALRAEFHSSFTTLGTIATASAMLYGLGALPAGLLVDRLGAPVLLRVFAGLSILLCLLAAAAPGIWWLALVLGLLGAAGALYHPAGVTEITLSVPGGGRVLGLHGSWGNLGTAVAPLLAGAIASVWTWRASYVLAGVAAALLLLAIWRGMPLDRTLPVERSTGRREQDRLTVGTIMLLSVAEGFVFQGFVVFLPAFMAQVGGLGQAAAAKGGALSAAVLLLGVPAQLAGGRLADAEGRSLALRYACLYAGAIVLGVAVGWAGAGLLGLLLAALFGVLIFVGQPISNQLVSRATREGRRGAAYGTYFSLSFGVGALAGTMGGLVADRWGLAAVFALLGMVAVLNVLGGLAARRRLARLAASTTTPSRS